MEVADTRKGNPIWIDWTFDHTGRISPLYQEFDSAEENYDAWVVFDYLLVRAVDRKEGFNHSYSYSDAAKSYRRKLIAINAIFDQEIVLGAISSKARFLYAKSLLRVEFRD